MNIGYILTTGEVVLNIALDRISQFSEYGLENHTLTTMFTQIVSTILLIIKWCTGSYNYRVNQKTVFYLVILTMMICLKYNLKVYAMSMNIPLYKNYLFKTLYFPLKPLLTYTNGATLFLNLTHLFTIIPLAIYQLDSLQVSFFATLYEFIDLLILDELEAKFYLDMLIPQLYLLIQNFGELITNSFTVYKQGIEFELSDFTTNRYGGVFLITEALILLLALYNKRVKRYTIEKQQLLFRLDSHVSNSVDILFNFLQRLYNSKTVYLNLVKHYLLDELTIVHGVILVVHTTLYAVEFMFYIFE